MQRSAEPRIPVPDRRGRERGELRLSAADRVSGGGSTSDRGVSSNSKTKGERPRRGKPAKTRRARAKGRGGFARLRRLVYWGFLAGIWAFVALVGLVGWQLMHLPADSELAIPARPPNIRIVAMDGSVIGNRGETGGEEVRLFELPPYLPQAVMAIEDRRFYSHFGIDPLGLMRAVVVNLTSGDVVQGGSTLTQQLAKNLYLKPDRTISRKLQELGLALWLEWKFSKDEILEMYLNRVYLGAGAYGVEAAARRYYDKSARDLTLSEAATIAGLLKAPSRYAPTVNPDLAEERMQTVVAAMQDAGFITEDEAKYALVHAAEVHPGSEGGSLNYVADWVAALVPGFIGKVTGDIVVDTTVDPRLQLIAEKNLRAVLDKEGKAKNASQGAAVVMDPFGAVRALVGGKDYRRSEFNRAVDARRQPGSAFKPFVYLAAMEAGLSPMSRRVDEPVRIGNYTPENYDGKYHGPVRLADALARSINTVAVRLADEVGVQRVTETARKLGIRSPLENNLSIALGTSEVSLLELTGAYVPLANGGYGVVPHVIRRIRTVDGDVLYERSGGGPGQIVSIDAVGKMNFMLRETVEDGTGRRAALEGRPAAGKTGTTQSYKDAWFVGYTASYVAGVWVGNDDNKPMKRVTGGSLPAEAWNGIMLAAHKDVPVIDLPGNYVPVDNGGELVADGSLPWANGERPVADAVEKGVKQVGRGIGGLFRSLFGR
ncbi:MAG: transglycosylase domain-containing protein [Flavobacteriaceae bacterium]